MKVKTFLVHWLDGTTEKMQGITISEAFMSAGYGGGSISAVDYYEELK